MSSTIGSSTQFTGNIAQNAGQRNNSQSVQNEPQRQSQPTVQATKSAENYQKLAEKIIADRASGQTPQPSTNPQRGQNLNILV